MAAIYESCVCKCTGMNKSTRMAVNDEQVKNLSNPVTIWRADACAKRNKFLDSWKYVLKGIYHHYAQKATSVAGRGGPWGCEMSRLSYFLSAHRCRQGCQLSSRLSFTPRKIPGTHFWVDPRAIVWLEGSGQLKKKINWPHQESNPRPSGLLHSVPYQYTYW
jgi:hypothetical protein